LCDILHQVMPFYADIASIKPPILSRQSEAERHLPWQRHF
jgi:hypothetical protein